DRERGRTLVVERAARGILAALALQRHPRADHLDDVRPGEQAVDEGVGEAGHGSGHGRLRRGAGAGGGGRYARTEGGPPGRPARPWRFSGTRAPRTSTMSGRASRSSMKAWERRAMAAAMIACGAAPARAVAAGTGARRGGRRGALRG